MNKGFITYYKEGKKLAFFTIFKKKGNFIRYWSYIFMKLLSVPLFIAAPIVNMAGVKIAKEVKAGRNVKLADAMSAIEKPKTYYTSIMAFITKFLMILGLLLPFGLMAILGELFTEYLVNQVIGNPDIYMYLQLIFVLPFVVAGVLIFLYKAITLLPDSYILETKPKMGLKDVLYQNFYAFKKQGKWTLFMTYLLQILVCGLFIALPILVMSDALGLYSLIGNDIITNLIAILLFVSAFIFVPVFWMAYEVTRVSLFDDVTYFIATKAEMSRLSFEVKEEQSRTSIETDLVQLFEGNLNSLNDMPLNEPDEYYDDDDNDDFIYQEESVSKRYEETHPEDEIFEPEENEVVESTEVPTQEEVVVEPETLEVVETIEEETVSETQVPVEEPEPEAVQETSNNDSILDILQQINSNEAATVEPEQVETMDAVSTQEEIAEPISEEVVETVEEETVSETQEPLEEPEPETVLEPTSGTDSILDLLQEMNTKEEVDEPVVEEPTQVELEVEKPSEESVVEEDAFKPKKTRKTKKDKVEEE